jgi:hypothetical protein
VRKTDAAYGRLIQKGRHPRNAFLLQKIWLFVVDLPFCSPLPFANFNSWGLLLALCAAVANLF